MTHVTSPVGRGASVRTNPDLHTIWISSLDRQLVELNNRFQKGTYGIMSTTASLLFASDTFGQMDFLGDGHPPNGCFVTSHCFMACAQALALNPTGATLHL